MPSTDSTRPLPKARLSAGLIVSLGFHLVLALVLLAWYVPRSTADVADGRDPTQPPAVPRPAAAPTSDSIVGSEFDPLTDASFSPPIPPEEVEAAIAQAIETADRAPEPKQLSELANQLRRLDRISSPESIAAVGETIRETIGLPERASAPTEQTGSGSFDFKTAQFHDVVRTGDSPADWSYHGVLIDAAGRLMEVELDLESGRTAYDTMNLIKRSALGEAVYRSVVLPMLDKLIEREP